MPVMISNRSTLTTFYETTKSDGFEVLFHSSQGNEALIEANQAQIGSDVVTNNVLTWMEFKPYDGGIELKHIVKMDPNGMIPGFIKDKAAKRLANTLLIIVDYLQNGTVPEPMF